ncbi:MAG: ABC transporter permease [Rhodothalassiaceae bacterium]
MNAAYVIASQEIANGFRNRWVLGACLLMILFSLALATLGSAPVGVVGARPFAVLVVSLASLSTLLVPMLALLLAHDAIVGEAERGTLALTLAYPVSRRAFLLGKFMGHLAILALAIIAGLGTAAALLVWRGAVLDGDAAALAQLALSALLLGAAFLALGYVASSLVRERTTAAAIAIGLWLVLVLVYDLAFLALLVDAGEAIPRTLVAAAIAANPVDAFRLINLGMNEATALISGMEAAGRAIGLSPATLYGALLAWLFAALGLGWALFRRREL